MGHKNQPEAAEIAEPKKRRRVKFFATDSGVEASECIKIFLVSCKEQVGAGDAPCIDPIDLNGFFDDDGKIYGYQELKITIWVSSISFHAYPDIKFQSSSDAGKGITDLKLALQKIFGENIVEKKDDFLQTFSTDSNYIRSVIADGDILQQKVSKGCISNSNCHLDAEASDVEVIRMVMSNAHFGHLYSRLVPLVLLLVDGCSPIDINDPQWELYLLIQKNVDQQYLLLGFAALYRFYHYPDSLRLRLSQILVLPPYQHKGHGRRLLEVLNNVALSENVFDLTVEEPLDYLQHVRTCIDTLRLLAFDPVRPAVDAVVSQMKHRRLSKNTHPTQFGPPSDVMDDVRERLKVTKKHFYQCWEVLIYLGLEPVNEYMENYKTFLSDRIKADIIGKDSETKGKLVVDVPSEYDEEMSFVMFRARAGEAGSVQIDGNQASQEEQLQQLVDERLKEIESIAQKVSAYRTSN